MKKLIWLILMLLLTDAAIAQTRRGMYYVSGKPGQHGIWFTEQSWDGSWQRGSRVLLNGVFDGDAVDPEILPQPNGSYRMYYYKGYFVTPPPPNPGLNKIFLAESTDALSYTVIGEAFAYQNIFDPSVVKLPNGDYLMACTQSVGTAVNTVLAKSTNGGITFSYQSTLNNTGVPELFVLNDGSVRLFYNGPGGIISQKSTDNGSSWQVEPGLRFSAGGLGFVGDPSVLKVGPNNNNWWLFVKGFNNNGSQGLTSHRIMLATSSDETNTFNIQRSLVLDSASVPEGVVLFTNTSVEPQGNAATFSLYPNPTTTEAVIKSTEYLNDATVELFDSRGACVQRKVHCQGEAVQLSVAELPAGLYWVRLTEGGKLYPAQKLVVVSGKP